MSEYQFFHFLAIDRPLDDAALEFMRRQSTRAEITRWQFTNEYHFGDFHGNAREMLRRGYDIHLHYANFGVRKLMIRLRAGLPCDRRTFQAFQVQHCVHWDPDKKGRGGILTIEPQADPGSYEEEFYDADTLLPAIAPVRELLIGGDLRPLYLAWLACNQDDEAQEPPVPAGLDKPGKPLSAMAAFYEVSQDLVAAAAEHSPPLPNMPDASQTLSDWIAAQPPEVLRDLARRLLSGDAAGARSETLARVRDETGAAAWPVAEPARTFAQLREAAGRMREHRSHRKQREQEKARRKRLAGIAADPAAIIAKVQTLVKERSLTDYEQAAAELADLCEALGPDKGPKQAQAAAEKLRRQYPTRKLLISALRKRGLLR